MSITKEFLEVEKTLNNKINNVLSFLGIKAKTEKGDIISSIIPTYLQGRYFN